MRIYDSGGGMGYHDSDDFMTFIAIRYGEKR